MNILLINGSPKGQKSNTYKLAKAFLEGIKEKQEDCVIEEVFVNKLEINSCLGCFSCWSKTPGKCVINDDMQRVIEKILWADITIWSFPLYYFSIPGKLKTLIDRQLPMSLPFMVKDAESGSHPSRYDTSNKKNVIISTCGFYKTEGNYDAVISTFNHIFGKDNYEKLFCSQGELFRVAELSKRTNEYLGFVKEAGREYINGGIKENTKTKLNTLLFPRDTFEAMADASWSIEKETGEKLDESLVFTKQMAALYNKGSYTGKDIVLEMNYTDINKNYQIVLKKDSYDVLDKNFKTYTTKIETPYKVWRDIATGKISGEEALMKQMYKVKGDFNLMINWDKYFGETKKEFHEKKETKSKTNMLILLLPWIVFWVAVSINNYKGSIIAIVSCALIQMLFYKNKKTVYDTISNAIIIIFSVLVLINGKSQNLLPMSYLAFGLMWTVSCFFKIPLTAHYSANNYNGEKAFENPLFIKTNKLLTFMWGILYILTSALTVFVMKTSFASYLGIINNILPIFMGIFTAWFQKWYPAKVARG